MNKEDLLGFQTLVQKWLLMFIHSFNKHFLGLCVATGTSDGVPACAWGQRWTRTSSTLEDPMDTRTRGYSPQDQDRGERGSQDWGQGGGSPEQAPSGMFRAGFLGRRLLHLLLMNEQDRGLTKMRGSREGKGCSGRKGPCRGPERECRIYGWEVVVQ